MHNIRLRGPWEYLPLAHTLLLSDGSASQQTDDLPEGGRMRIPADWNAALGAFRGRVRFTRFFNLPTGLEKGDTVWLVVEPPDAWGEVRLNDGALGSVAAGEPAARYDVTDRLLERNELIIEVECPQVTPESAPLTRPDDRAEEDAGGLVGEVRLEIDAEF
jgi:hypothetical protein